MAYEESNSLDLDKIKAKLAEVLENAGFSAFEEYTDFDSRKAEGCIAVCSVKGVKIVQAGRRISTGERSFRGEIVFLVRLMGHYGSFDDYAEFDDRCFTACADLACVRDYGRCAVELGAAKSDIQQRRLVREAEAVFRVCMKQV